MSFPTLPKQVPQTNRPFFRWLGRTVLKLYGWRLNGNFPDHPKFVAAVAPHTSNWDFVFAIAIMFALNLEVKFLGKDAIFIWPFAGLLKRFGGIPVNRRAKHGLVGQMVEHFERNEKLVLGIAPEGTRSKTKEWKTGFLQIAVQANVPVVPVCLDFKNKQVIVKGPIAVNDNIQESLDNVKAQFPIECAKFPQKA